jgi:PAS domain S-box-containing protein
MPSDVVRQIEALRAMIAHLREVMAAAGDRETPVAEVLPQLERALETLEAQAEAMQVALESARVDRERYHELFAESPEAFLVTDQRGVIREANKAAALLLNTSPPFLVGHAIAEFISQEERPSFRSELSGGSVDETQDWDVQMKPRKAAPFAAALTMTPMMGAAGAVEALRWHIKDVTARTLLACLWRLRSRTRELRALVLKTSVGLELRVVQPDGVMISSELLKEWPAVLEKSEALRQMLESKGWQRVPSAG